jgi:dTMP kinase
VRDILKTRRNFDIGPRAELFLFSACRSQLIADVIGPALSSGQVVVCDRFTDSTIVYQGYGRGLDMGLIRSVNDIATGGLKPDLTILLDTEPETGLRRKHSGSEDRFETENIAFHKKIRNGYLELAAGARDRWLVVESGLSIEQVSNTIWERVFPLIATRYPVIEKA